MNSVRFDAQKNYFAQLGVASHDCDATIKKAFRRLARRYHPDVSQHPAAKEKFQAISEAYEVLRKHRSDYWQAFCRHQSRHCDNRTDHTSSSFSQNASRRDWNAHAHQAPVRGKDRHITFPVTLRYAIRLLKEGYFYMPSIRVRMKFTREAFLGKTFRLRGKGYPGLFGGEPGDYWVRFELRHPGVEWQLEGNDLYGQVAVPPRLLVPGQEVTIQAPTGATRIKIPTNYQSSDYICVSQQGLPGDHRHRPGNLYACLVAA